MAGQDRRGRGPPQSRRLGIPARRHRRLQPPSLRRGPRQREGQHGDRVPSPRRRLLRRPQRHRWV